MGYLTPTTNEEEILKALRELEPFEEITIRADNMGRPDSYIVTQTHKYSLDSRGKTNLK